MNKIESLISKLIAVNEAYSECSHELDDIKAQRQSIKRELIDEIKLSGLDAASANGKTARVTVKRTYSIIDPDQFLACDNDYHTAALYSVNSNKLNSFCKDLETIYGELPNEIAKSLNVFEYEDLSLTKLK